MKSTTFLFAAVTSFLLAFWARGQQGGVSLPLPVPAVMSVTGTTIRMYASKPLEQCVLVQRGPSNTYGRVVSPDSLYFVVTDAQGTPVDGLSARIPRPLYVDQAELARAAETLGKRWKPTNSDDEQDIVLFALLRKLGSGLVPGPALDAWAAQVGASLKAAINNPLSVEARAQQ